uniref:Uncharacterized protein LOC102805923 n=1 Tax=Saccoglossus kowalevskii TaxID=10224 RepID=A0ABM0N0N2_SACKO|nr:PREDICTED: uncharacterized protein LOC102805923 [Saccoglossus kowalevskii]
MGNTIEAANILSDLLFNADDGMKRKCKLPQTIRKFDKKSNWFDDYCKYMKQQTRKALNQFRNCRSVVNLENYITHRNNYRILLRDKKILFNNLKKREVYISENNQNTKEFWNLLNSKKSGSSTKIQPSAWHVYFSQLFASTDLNYGNESNMFLEEVQDYLNNLLILPESNAVIDYYQILDQAITIVELEHALSRLNANKTAGIDGLLPEIFKHIPMIFKQLLVKLFNTILNTGIFPPQWVHGLIIPVYEKGERDSVNNYRGITLLPSITTVFSDIIYNRLLNWVNLHYPTVEEQAGFRKNYSSVDNLFVLSTIIDRYL